ncbi:MAG TPA: hypothetical protein VEF89_11670 [Solirubrobacteraceae bacterium]|nr:hypothetical protein [Solirubrobacteraceae bacterium]
MKAMPYDAPDPGGRAPDAPAPDASEEDWGGYDEEEDQDYELPRRPRRRFFNPWTAAALAVVLGAIGFYVGVRVEKSQLANSTTTSALSALAGTGTGTRTGAARTGTGATGASASGASGASGAGGGGAFRSLFGGGGAGGSATIGTVSSISGDTLYVTETSGNMVKVTLSSATKVSKSVTVGKDAVRPGDLVTVAGAKSSDGTVSATTVNDTGASPFGGSSGSSGSSSSGSSASSAVGSLFGGGGG